MRQLAFVLMILPIVLVSTIKVEAAEIEERQWQDESIYYIKVDRFMNGEVENDENIKVDNPNAYHGGDLQGVIEQLDYIKDLGFTTIELSPIMDNAVDGYHGYWVEDFRSVDEHFGSMETARKLVEKAHEKDLNVIFDFVISHVSEDHPWVSDPEKTEWFLDERNGVTSNTLTQGLPELNTDDPQVKQYLIDTAKMWVKETGVDGFRLVSSSNVAPSFYESFSEQLNEVKEDMFLYSTTPISSEAIGENKLDGFLDQDFQETARETFKETETQLEPLYRLYKQNEEKFPSGYQVIHSIDGSVTSRFTHLTVEENQNPITRWKLALTYLFTTPGIPLIQYGSELPLDDGGELGGITMMDFNGGDEQMKRRVEKLTSMRSQFPALTRGDFEQLHSEDGFAVYKRTYKDETMLIGINNSEETKVVEIESLPDNRQLRGLLQDGIVRQQENGSYRLGMERETADVFVTEPSQGYNWLFIGFVGGVLGLFVVAVTVISVKNRKMQQ